MVPYARFSQYIRKPTGDMPPYTTKVLSDQDIADIYAWVNARPKPPAVDTLPAAGALAHKEHQDV